MDIDQSMLKDKHLPKEYYIEVVECSVYDLKKSPTLRVKYHAPQQDCSGNSYSMSHFRIFECVAYAQVPNQTREKLDDHNKKCIFIAYCHVSKAYHLHNPITKKMIISRGVEFKEEESWDGSVDQLVARGIPLPYGDNE